MLAQINTNMQKRALRAPEKCFLYFSACLYLFGPASWFTGCWPGLQDANPLASWVASCLSHKPDQDTSAVEEEMWSVTHALWAIILQALVQAAAAPAQLNSGPGSGRAPRPASACVLKGCMPMPATIALHVRRQ